MVAVSGMYPVVMMINIKREYHDFDFIQSNQFMNVFPEKMRSDVELINDINCP